VRPGPAAGPDALTEASRGAGLVVVGSHGLGAFGRAVLDSADRAALRRAGVPVLVVRG
jgi:nucleotide-binding universal stress UspA family protein